MTNPCTICLVQASCKVLCDDFYQYVEYNLTPMYYGLSYVIATGVRLGTWKLCYLGNHIIGVNKLE